MAEERFKRQVASISSERLHPPVPLQGGTIAQPLPCLEQRHDHYHTQLQAHAVPCSCPPRRSLLQARKPWRGFQQYRNLHCSSARAHPCCEGSPCLRRLTPTRTLACDPWPRPVCLQAACSTGTRARRRAAAAPPAPRSWLRRCIAGCHTGAGPRRREIAPAAEGAGTRVEELEQEQELEQE